ncbi:MAG: HlyD family type I secretion periplasmic adaptor subunit [Magnetococcales bacterium]|nr:HlyD family type I secretion periplasmic adaptor subunit [Magnetococcales bacterium]
MNGLLHRLFRRPTIAAQILLTSLVINFLGLSSSIYVIQVFNRYMGHGIDATLYTLSIGLVLALVMELVFRLVRQKLAGNTVIRPDHFLEERLSRSLTLAQSSALDGLPPGIRLEAFRALGTIQTAYSPANILTLVDLPFALFFLSVVYLLAPSLGGAVLLVLLLSISITLLGGYFSQKGQQELLQSMAQQSTLSTTMENRETVRAFNVTPFLLDRWRERTKKTHKLRAENGDHQALIQSLLQSIGGIMTLVVIGFGARLAILGQMDMGTLIGANILAARGLMMISRFAQINASLIQARQSVGLLARLYNLPKESVQGTQLARYSGRLEFKDMAFRHPGSSAPLFESVSFTVEPGEVLVVSGDNGSGKTTLARLLVGLMEPDRGSILVDGVDLRQIHPAWWRQQMVYLPQNPTLIHATLRENLTILNPQIEDQRLESLLRRVGLGPFLDENSNGLDRMMENGAPHLSRGILRRLALVRAMVSEGVLVLLDEPTDGLDHLGMIMMAEVIRDLNEQGRTLVVFSSQSDILKSNGQILDLNTKPIPTLSKKKTAPSVKRKNWTGQSCQPAALSGLEESLDSVVGGRERSGFGLGLLLIGLFAVMLFWANQGRLDVMSLSQGEVVPASKVQQVQHLEGGIIREILVQEGELVEKNQPLIVLDSIASRSDVDAIILKMNALEVDLLRLQVEDTDQKELILPEKWQNDQLGVQAKNLFYARQRSLASELESHGEMIEQRKEEIQAILARLAKQKLRMKIVQEQIDISSKMVSEALSSRYEHLDHLKEKNLLESQIEADGSALKQSESILDQTKEEMSGIVHRFKETVRAEIEEAQRNLNELTLRLKKFEDNRQRTVLRAPVKGIIKTLYVSSQGGVVTPGGTVLDIVPGEDRLLVEAKLPAQDVGHVQIDQKVIIQLASGEASHFGKLSGKVIHISPDSVVEEGGFAYYVVRVSVERDYFSDGIDRYKLVPGVIVTAGIVTGQRTVLEYLMGPLANGVDFALSER